ncbi:MAG: zinc ribbon domain-containing protein [Bacilli bacterium]|nr:zinc ribbon domain-containing protein [Bacilli bacterium]
MKYIILAPVFLIIGIVFIIIYVLLALLLSNLNKQIYGKKSIIAWIPVLNLYLLGKLTVNKLVGIILIVANLISYNYSITINGVEKTYSLLPSSVRYLVSGIVSIVTLVLYGMAIAKYIKIVSKDAINNSVKENSQSNNNTDGNKKVIEAEIIKEEKVEEKTNEVLVNCRNCGAPISQGDSYCQSCGSRLS